MYEGVGRRTMTDCFSNWPIASMPSRSNVRLVFRWGSAVSYRFCKPVGHACPAFSEAEGVCRMCCQLPRVCTQPTTVVEPLYVRAIFVPEFPVQRKTPMRRKTSFGRLPVMFTERFSLNMPPKKKSKPDKDQGELGFSVWSSDSNLQAARPCDSLAASGAFAASSSNVA